MMMSMYSAVSGLKSQQTKLNVIGNNIANINTVGYKSQKVGFSDLLSQNISGASGASGNMGGTNAKQIGLGSQVSSIEMVMNPGSSQYTGSDTDVALGGEGFFIVQGTTATDYRYTRAGNFGVDTAGNLVVNGMKVCGYGAKDGVIDSSQTGINLFDNGKYSLKSKTTANASLAGNLDNSKSTAQAPTTITNTLTVYDVKGTAHETTITFKNVVTPGALPTDPGTPTSDWTVTVATSDGADTTVVTDPDPMTVTFDSDGKIDPLTNAFKLSFTALKGGATAPQTVAIDLTSVNGYATATGTSSVKVDNIDGYAAGDLTDFSIGADGVITGSYSNGQKKSVGQLVVATFNNSAGLEKIGDNLYDRTMNSGEPAPETPGSGQAAKLTTGALEMSNVDLANEFSEMMITQRAYQANSKIITTSDTLMETLINMSR